MTWNLGLCEQRLRKIPPASAVLCGLLHSPKVAHRPPVLECQTAGTADSEHYPQNCPIWPKDLDTIANMCGLHASSKIRQEGSNISDDESPQPALPIKDLAQKGSRVPAETKQIHAEPSTSICIVPQMKRSAPSTLRKTPSHDMVAASYGRPTPTAMAANQPPRCLDVIESQAVAVARPLRHRCLEVNESLGTLWHDLVLVEVDVEEAHRLVRLEVDGLHGA